MKAISLLQPWAQFCVTGDKRVETRSWNTKHRGALLIHASASNKMGVGRDDENKVLYRIRQCVDFGSFLDLPFGAIIGCVNLVDTFQFGSDESIAYVNTIVHKHGRAALDKEITLGDWSEGRWGWVFENPVMFDMPIPYKGSLSLWDYPEPLPELYKTL